MRQLAHEIKKYIRVLKVILSMSFQKFLEYRSSFVISSISINLWIMAEFAWVFIAFDINKVLGGYEKWQYVGLMGFYFFAINLFWGLFDKSLNNIMPNIYEGRIDSFLLKPISPQFSISVMEIGITYLVNSFTGLAVFFYAIYKSGMVVHFSDILIAAIVLILFLITFYSISFALNCTVFWLGMLKALRSPIADIPEKFGKIPTGLYGRFRWVELLFYLVIPVALVTTIPTSFVYWGTKWEILGYYVLLTAAFFAISKLVWKLGMKSYTSAGG